MLFCSDSFIGQFKDKQGYFQIPTAVFSECKPKVSQTADSPTAGLIRVYERVNSVEVLTQCKSLLSVSVN